MLSKEVKVWVGYGAISVVAAVVLMEGLGIGPSAWWHYARAGQKEAERHVEALLQSQSQVLRLFCGLVSAGAAQFVLTSKPDARLCYQLVQAQPWQLDEFAALIHEIVLPYCRSDKSLESHKAFHAVAYAMQNCREFLREVDTRDKHFAWVTKHLTKPGDWVVYPWSSAHDQYLIVLVRNRDISCSAYICSTGGDKVRYRQYNDLSMRGMHKYLQRFIHRYGQSEPLAWQEVIAPEFNAREEASGIGKERKGVIQVFGTFIQYFIAPAFRVNGDKFLATLMRDLLALAVDDAKSLGASAPSMPAATALWSNATSVMRIQPSGNPPLVDDIVENYRQLCLASE